MSLIPIDSHFDFDHFFNHFRHPVVSKEPEDSFFSPKVDIKETKKNYEIIADLPGVDKENLTITLDKGVLTISASKSDEKTEEEEGKIVRRERHSGSYMRRFDLGPAIKDSDIDAEFKNGVLKLTVPKAEEVAPESKRIEVR